MNSSSAELASLQNRVIGVGIRNSVQNLCSQHSHENMNSLMRTHKLQILYSENILRTGNYMREYEMRTQN